MKLTGLDQKLLKKIHHFYAKIKGLEVKNYPFWRLDKIKLQINGGWHFSFLQTPDQI